MNKDEIIARAREYIRLETDDFFKADAEKALLSEDYKDLEDRFYRDLEFGTGGLRGIIGGGTNRMNALVVSRATQGLVNYVTRANPEKSAKGELRAVIAYDSRNYSQVFAEKTALIFAANGFTAWLFTSLRPTPELSYAIRALGCDTGVVVTASHNPPQYNGYKAYWSDGAQVIPPHDEGIIREVNAVSSVKTMPKSEALERGLLRYIDAEIDEPYQRMVKTKLFRPDLIKETTEKIVYTPLHGTGAVPVRNVLSSLGLAIETVPEQAAPNGDFPTVAYPNPEDPQALKMAIELGEKRGAGVVMATDPDADRFGCAVPDENGRYVPITGNQMGALFTDYICLSHKEKGTLPANAAIIRSIVTSTLSDRIAKSYGVACAECLTGFKWIADAMASFEKTGDHSYIFGFEESYGYNIENEVRDKDGVAAAALCAELTVYWKSRGKTLLERLNELYVRHGYFEDYSFSKAFPGAEGGAKMSAIMNEMRTNTPKALGNQRVVSVRDVLRNVVFDPADPDAKTSANLPASDVLQFYLEDGARISARPSGTEPKIKFYFCCPVDGCGGDIARAKEKASAVIAAAEKDIRAILERV